MYVVQTNEHVIWFQRLIGKKIFNSKYITLSQARACCLDCARLFSLSPGSFQFLFIFFFSCTCSPSFVVTFFSNYLMRTNPFRKRRNRANIALEKTQEYSKSVTEYGVIYVLYSDVPCDFARLTVYFSYVPMFSFVFFFVFLCFLYFFVQIWCWTNSMNENFQSRLFHFFFLFLRF